MANNTINFVKAEKVMRALHIESRSTLFKMRNEGKIDFVRVGPRLVLYPDWVLNGTLRNPKFIKSEQEITLKN